MQTGADLICPEPGSDLSSLMEEQLSAVALEAARSARACSERTGVPAYVVGGPVRDMILGSPVADIDVVVEGDGIGFARVMAEVEGAKTVPYARFGTALVVLPGGIKVDVATARTERYPEPGALPEVEAGTLESDLYRRDFTINSMAVRLGPDRFGEFVDLHGGCSDLKEGIIRVLHDGSFRDDPTRILRAVRFRARYGFEIEETSARLLAEAVSGGMLDEVSRQRLREEIVAILKEKEPARSVLSLYESGCWTELFGNYFMFPEGIYELFERVDEVMDWFAGVSAGRNFPETEGWLLRWLVMLESTPPDRALELTREFHMGRKAGRCAGELENQIPEMIELLTGPGDVSNSELYWGLGSLAVESILMVVLKAGNERVSRDVERYAGELRDIVPWVGGAELMEMGMEEGPDLGRVLKEVFTAQLDGLLTNREDAFALAERLIEAG